MTLTASQFAGVLLHGKIRPRNLVQDNHIIGFAHAKFFLKAIPVYDVFHGCKANTVDLLFFAQRNESDGQIKGQAMALSTSLPVIFLITIPSIM